MKLSIIVPIYKQSKELSKFLKKMLDQTSYDFELVFIIDTNLENPLELIQNYKEKTSAKMQVIFNSKRIGRTRAISVGLEMANGEFATIVATSNIFDVTYVYELNKLIEKQPADIIEFKGSMKEPIKINGEMRVHVKGVVNIKDKPSIIAYTYPFDFNKIWRTKIIKKVFQNHSNITFDSRFAIEYIYNAFLVSQTYSHSNNKIVVAKSSITQNFNPLKLFNQWDFLHKTLKNNHQAKYFEEMMYAEFMHESIFLSALVGTLKNKMLINKMSIIYDENFQNKFKNFSNNNKYSILKNNETKLIKDNQQIANLTKVYKETW